MVVALQTNLILYTDLAICGEEGCNLKKQGTAKRVVLSTSVMRTKREHDLDAGGCQGIHLRSAAEQQHVADAVDAQGVGRGQGLHGADEEAIGKWRQHAEVVLGQHVAHAQLGGVADGRLQQLLLLGCHVRAAGACLHLSADRCGRGRPLVRRQLPLLALQHLIHPAWFISTSWIDAAIVSMMSQNKHPKCQ